MDHLIHLLQEVDKNPELYRMDSESAVIYNLSHPVIRDIIEYANEYLTVGPNVHDHREQVRKAGYPVYPGEVDRFGWLTAYFQMKHGILLFG